MAITFTVVMVEAALTARSLGMFVLLRFSPSGGGEEMSYSRDFPVVVLI